MWKLSEVCRHFAFLLFPKCGKLHPGIGRGHALMLYASMPHASLPAVSCLFVDLGDALPRRVGDASSTQGSVCRW